MRELEEEKAASALDAVKLVNPTELPPSPVVQQSEKDRSWTLEGTLRKLSPRYDELTRTLDALRPVSGDTPASTGTSISTLCVFWI